MAVSDKATDGKYCFAIDRGGTFTDVFCICPDGKVKTLKLLSEDPARYSDAPREGIRRILKTETGHDVTSSGLVDTSRIGWIRMGTTVATNALLERKGDPVALVVNKGFRDLLYIGNQARPKIFDLNIQKPSNLYRTVLEVDCRIVPQLKERCQLRQDWKVLEGVAGTKYLEMSTVNESMVTSELKKIREEGINSVAILLAHSYACPIHEIQIGAIAKKLGFSSITLSHEAMPMCRVVARGYTACAEAYLTPHVKRYLASFKSGFERELDDIDVLFMQSDGGLTKMENFRGARAILSGPAGGVVGYAVTGSRETEQPLIGFDMGGTSTDVSRYDASYEHVIESTTAGITIQAPQLDINTVAAGGGSRLFFRSGLFVVGPESAGAHPGPTCYKKGGPLTVTDANLILGRLLPQYFPKIFGPQENEALDYEASKKNFEKLQEEINAHLKASGDKKQLSLEDVALGYVRVANEAMCRPIRALTQSRGLDTSQHVLSCFGGAGGQHACSIARDLGMSKVLVHKYAGVLSAYGMALADVVQECQEPCGLVLEENNFELLKNRLDALSKKCRTDLMDQGFKDIELQAFLHLRYEGTDGALMCSPKPTDNTENNLVGSYGNFYATFIQRYLLEFGFVLHNRRVIVDDIRMRGLGKNTMPTDLEIPMANNAAPIQEGTTTIYFESGVFNSPIYCTKNFLSGHKITGPAILIDQLSTILIEPECSAEVTRFGDLIINVSANTHAVVDHKLDAIQLSIFSHRFMSIAEQMGSFPPISAAHGLLISDFKNNFLRVFPPIFRVIVDDIRMRGLGKNTMPTDLEIPMANNAAPIQEGTTTIYFESGVFNSPIYCTKNFLSGHKITGPAILIDQLSTILIEPECSAEVTRFGDLIINVSANTHAVVDHKLDAIQLSIFSHRFMSIAEQMGRVLQRTSISTNIKERLDFSCALFGPDGGLVSNAPHIPVHLGAMQETVQYQLKVRGDSLKSGDVILSNHPQAGGSHLPDLTVITPVFNEEQSRPVFFVASRGHHADIGGITPGSMPPHSTSLDQEGAAFKSFLIVENGKFQEEKVVERLTTPTAAKGAKGTRNLSENISDLKAQIAANHKGIQLVSELISYYSLKVVQAYMSYIQENAEIAVRDMLKQIAKDTLKRTGSTVLEAEEFMDDGSPIKLKVTIDEKEGTAVCDFTGSGTEVWGNCNAPRAVTLSALIYCLRCMVGHDVPLNQGCLAPIKAIIPKNSMLDPSENAAVVGGNVLTSQRVVDTILKAFRVCAASQGCMNNITFGDNQWGYYETVAGGAGAGPDWDGADGVHTHMTNTRITDPEILELRFPIILNRFCLRTDNSGGSGVYKGGEGVERELLFRKPVTLSVLTERRTLQPYGMVGGQPGKRGLNLLRKQDGRLISLGGKTVVDIETGDTFLLKTPGGGGYGIPSNTESKRSDASDKPTQKFIGRGTVYEYQQMQESA